MAARAAFSVGALPFSPTFPEEALEVTTSPALVAVSVGVSLLGSLCFLQFMDGDETYYSEARCFLLEALGAAVVYGAAAAWSLHFLSMSSLVFPDCARTRSNFLGVFLSCVWPTCGAFGAFCILVRLRKVREYGRCFPRCTPSGLRQWTSLCTAALSMCSGIVLMHYTGMMSMMGVEQVHSLYGFFAALLSGLVLNLLAAALVSRRGISGATHQIPTSFMLTAAVAVPHFVSTGTVSFYAEDPKRFVECMAAYGVLSQRAQELGLPDELDGTMINQAALLVAAFSAAIVVTALGVRLFARQRRLHRWKKESTDRRIKRAVAARSQMSFPMVAMRSDHFLQLGKLRYHEEMRDSGLLTFFDSPSDVKRTYIALFSHQWLSWSAADPNGAHYAAMVEATKELLEREGLTEEELYIWVDTFSIPQANGIGATQNAIDALALYSSLASALVVIAPLTRHVDTGELCDLKTYMKRCWCRVEQACHILSKGTANYYILEDDGLRGNQDLSELDMDALFVFEGELTCCRRRHPGGIPCDRERLVDTMLGMIYVILGGGDSSASFSGPHPSPRIREMVMQNKTRLFPREIRVEEEHGRVAVRELFGDLVRRLEWLAEIGALEGSSTQILPQTAVGEGKQVPVVQEGRTSFTNSLKSGRTHTGKSEDGAWTYTSSAASCASSAGAETWPALAAAANFSPTSSQRGGVGGAPGLLFSPTVSLQSHVQSSRWTATGNSQSTKSFSSSVGPWPRPDPNARHPHAGRRPSSATSDLSSHAEQCASARSMSAPVDRSSRRKDSGQFTSMAAAEAAARRAARNRSNDKAEMHRPRPSPVDTGDSTTSRISVSHGTTRSSGDLAVAEELASGQAPETARSGAARAGRAWGRTAIAEPAAGALPSAGGEAAAIDGEPQTLHGIRSKWRQAFCPSVADVEPDLSHL